MQTRNKPKQKYSLLQRIAIGTCLLVSLAALIIMMFVIVTMRQLIAIDFEEKIVTVVEEYPSTIKVEMPEHLTKVSLLKSDMSKVNVPKEETNATNSAINTEVNPTEFNVPEFEFTEVVCDENVQRETETNEKNKNILPVIENMEDNLSKWCLSNDSDNSVSLWKVTDRGGNLLISLKDEEGKILATFRFEGIESEYEEWVCCDDFFEQVTISDLIDYSFVSYHEVGGKNAENVQAQVAVLINRQNHQNYSNVLRKVITQSGQYSCAKCVTNRWLKSNNYLESEDLEKCFRQVLLYLGGELIQEVPSNVIFAAPREQGSGIWKVINGTYYCF